MSVVADYSAAEGCSNMVEFIRSILVTLLGFYLVLKFVEILFNIPVPLV